MKRIIKSIFVVIIVTLYTTNIGLITAFGVYSTINEKIAETSSDETLFPENEECREEFAKHFRNDDSYIAIAYPYAIHEKNENGNWIDIDNSIIREKHTKYYKNSAKNFQVKFSEKDSQKLVSIITGTMNFSWDICDYFGKKIERSNGEVEVINSSRSKSDDVFLQAIEKTQSTIVYKDYFGEDVDLSYNILPYEIDENIILYRQTDFLGYSIKIEKKEICVKKDQNGSICIYRHFNAAPQFIINAPYMYDASDCISFNVETAIKETEDFYYISVEPDQIWLNDEDRKYPIVIDPVIKSTQTSSNTQDTYVFNGCSASSARATASKLYIGVMTENSIIQPHRAFCKIVSLPSIANPSLITSVSFVTQCWSGTSTSRPFSLYKANSSWNQNSINWANMPSVTSLVSGVNRNTSTNQVTFSGTSVTNTVKNWYIGANYGFMVRYTNESTSNPDYNSFYSGDNTTSSSYMPYLSITYTTPSITVESGSYYIKSAYSGKYLTYCNDMSGNVVQQAFIGSPAQRWKVTYCGSGYYRIDSPELSDYWGFISNTDISLSIANAGNANGTNVKTDLSSNNSAQRFSIISCGSNKYRIVPKCANTRCLDVTGPSTSDNANIQLWTYETVSQQQWIFEKCVQVFQTQNKYIYDQIFVNNNLPPSSYQLKEDMISNDKTKNEIQNAINTTASYIDKSVATHRSNWETLVNLTSTEPLNTVGLDMVDKFMNPSSFEYRNATLSTKAKEHDSTVTFIQTVKNHLESALRAVNGNINNLTFNNNNRLQTAFSSAMIQNGVQRPIFGNLNDMVSGLMICVHVLQGYEIVVKNYVKNGSSVSGTLHFVLYDHYGLDPEDVLGNNYNGFRSWYILQHYNAYNDAYRPFITIITFDEPFSFTL